MHTKLDYAMKFFASTAAFRDESAQFSMADSSLQQFLPPVHSILDNADEVVVDAGGNALPPCIVMERGESLDLWMQRNTRGMDTFTCMQVSAHV